MQRTAQSFYAVARFPIGGFRKRVNNFHHRFPWQNARYVMGHGGHDFTPASGGKVGEKSGDDLTGDVGESISVKKEKRGAPMALPQKFYEFGEGEDLLSFFFPLSPARFLSFSIKAVLRASS